MDLFLLTLFFILALLVFVIFQVPLGRFSSPYTATALALILANITMTIAVYWAYIYRMEQTIWGVALPVLLTFVIYVSALLLHQAKYKYDLSKILMFAMPIGILILLFTGVFMWLLGVFISGRGF
jgi:hypothetical protein